MALLDFSDALTQIKTGKHLTSATLPTGTYVCMATPKEFPRAPGSGADAAPEEDEMVLVSAAGQAIWNPNSANIMAGDWSIVS